MKDTTRRRRRDLKKSSRNRHKKANTELFHNKLQYGQYLFRFFRVRFGGVCATATTAAAVWTNRIPYVYTLELERPNLWTSLMMIKSCKITSESILCAHCLRVLSICMWNCGGIFISIKFLRICGERRQKNTIYKHFEMHFAHRSSTMIFHSLNRQHIMQIHFLSIRIDRNSYAIDSFKRLSHRKAEKWCATI